MEIYSDIDYKPEIVRFIFVGFSFCFIPFQLSYIFISTPYYAKLSCALTSMVLLSIPSFLYIHPSLPLASKRVDMIEHLLIYFIFIITMFIINSVISNSKYIPDINFYMCLFLVTSIMFGYFIGYLFSDKTKFFNIKNVIIRGNEIELRKVDMFGALSLNRMSFLRAPLIKMRNALYIVVFFIGTGGAGIGMGIAEMLKRSDVISPEVGVHSVLFFCLGMPVLFTFGILIYSMVTYLFEWRKLVARIEREYGEHKIIFNSQKKSYKKIREILDNQSSEQEKVNE